MVLVVAADGVDVVGFGGTHREVYLFCVKSKQSCVDDDEELDALKMLYPAQSRAVEVVVDDDDEGRKEYGREGSLARHSSSFD